MLHTLALMLMVLLAAAQRFLVRDLLLGGTYERSSVRKQRVVLTALVVLVPVEVVGMLILLFRELQTQGLV